MIDFLILVLMSIAESRWEKRVIMTRNNPPEKYLSRWFLLGGPQTEGMEDGDARAGWGLYLHCFHRSDDDYELHSHPWRWAVSLVLKNGYVEERITRAVGATAGVLHTVHTHACRAGQLNWLTDKTFHRVDLDRGEAWTLFLVGPKSQDWGFLDRRTWKYTDWRTFFVRKAVAARGSPPPGMPLCICGHTWEAHEQLPPGRPKEVGELGPFDCPKCTCNLFRPQAE